MSSDDATDESNDENEFSYRLAKLLWWYDHLHRRPNDDLFGANWGTRVIEEGLAAVWVHDLGDEHPPDVAIADLRAWLPRAAWKEVGLGCFPDVGNPGYAWVMIVRPTDEASPEPSEMLDHLQVVDQWLDTRYGRDGYVRGPSGAEDVERTRRRDNAERFRERLHNARCANPEPVIGTARKHAATVVETATKGIAVPASMETKSLRVNPLE